MNSERKRPQLRSPAGPEITSYSAATIASSDFTSSALATAGAVCSCDVVGADCGCALAKDKLESANERTSRATRGVLTGCSLRSTTCRAAQEAAGGCGFLP